MLVRGGTATLTNCTISGNNATGVGGGLSNDLGGTATLTNCTVSGNSSKRAPGIAGGGGLSNFYGTATLTNCTVSGNSATSCGGGLFTEGWHGDDADQLHRQRQQRYGRPGLGG